MKVMLLCADGANYQRDCWVKPLQEVFDTVFISCRIMRKYYSSRKLANYIMNILDNDEFEYVFYYSDGMRTNFLPEDFFPEVRDRCKLVVFHADDQPEKWFGMNAAKDYRYHIVFTHSSEAARRRVNGIYLQWGFNPNVHHKIDGVKKDIDVLFIGLNKCKEMAVGLMDDYYEDGYLRQKILTEIYYLCKSKGYKFALYGEGWQYHPVLHECNGGYISDEETVEAINRAKIVINIAFSWDNIASGFQTKLRHFEIGGCGSFQITNANPDLKELYGDSIGMVDNVDNLCDEIEYYLEHEKEREDKAQRAYEISLREHTMQHRMKEMFEKAADYFGEELKLSPSKAVFPISISYDDKKDLERKIEDIIASPDYERSFYHFYDSLFQLEDLNTSLLAMGEDSVGSIGSSIVSVFDISEKGTGAVLRRSLIKEGLFLPGIIGDDKNSEEMQSRLVSFKHNQGHSFVMNLIISGRFLKQLLTVIKEDKTLDCNLVCDSDVVIGDYIICTSERFYDVHTEAIRKVLSKRSEGKSVAFYGGRTAFADMAAREIKDSGDNKNVCMVDRDLRGLQELYGDMDYYPSDDMLSRRIKPDFIVLTSQRADVEMWNVASVLEKEAVLLPLSDMEHPNWNKL